MYLAQPQDACFIYSLIYTFIVVRFILSEPVAIAY